MADELPQCDCCLRFFKDADKLFEDEAGFNICLDCELEAEDEEDERTNDE